MGRGWKTRHVTCGAWQGTQGLLVTGSGSVSQLKLRFREGSRATAAEEPAGSHTRRLSESPVGETQAGATR